MVEQPETVAGCNQGCHILATMDGYDGAAIMWWWEVWVAFVRVSCSNVCISPKRFGSERSDQPKPTFPTSKRDKQRLP